MSNMTDITTVKLDPPTRDRLRAAKIGGETYDDTVNRLLDAYQAENVAEVAA